MDILSPAQPQTPQRSGKHWPHERAARGQTYGVEDPVFPGDKLVVMLNDTWLDYGTAFERIRRQLDEVMKASQKLKVSYDIAIKELAELRAKHENLRASEKRRRKAAMGLKSN